MWVAEIKIRAKRKIGEITKEIPTQTTNKDDFEGGDVATSKKQQLENAGITTI